MDVRANIMSVENKFKQRGRTFFFLYRAQLPFKDKQPFTQCQKGVQGLLGAAYSLFDKDMGRITLTPFM